MKRTALSGCARLSRAAALLVTSTGILLSAAPARAQLGDLVVTITQPSSGSTVSGTTTVSATTSPLGVVVLGVQFRVDGSNIGAEDTSAPYSVPWNTNTAANGSHVLSAVARSLLGLQVVSSPVTVTVSNDSTPPTVSITSPGAGASVTGTITVSASASDSGGVAGVQFRVDGNNLGGEDTSAPYSVSWNTASAGPGSHTLTAVARDGAGNSATSAGVTVTVTVPDTTPPSVNITSPGNGASVTGTITVSANASDNVGVAGVQFRVDGSNIGGEDTSAPYSVSWNTATAGAGSHTLTAVARDGAGNTTTSASVTVTVTVPDTTPPSVAITSPGNGASVTGTIAVSANASDNVGVAGVQFRVDGNNIGGEDTSAPYSVSWNTATAGAGSHTLTAVARDAAGNTTTSASVTVTVTVADTTPPAVNITSPGNGAAVSGTITVSANASDNVGVAGVQFEVDDVPLGGEDTSAPYSVSWNTATAGSGSHTLTAVARDAAGNTTTSTPVTVTVSVPDTTPPSVAITSPSGGANVSGTITVSANASDNVGVAGVQFRLDGAALGAEDTAAPYSVSWDTSTASAGTHSLTAVARDGAGNTATSAAVTVVVSNTGFAKGDVFVTIVDGTVQWRGSNGLLKGLLTVSSDGQASSAAFDASGQLYVPHWWGKNPGTPGNYVDRYDGNGNRLGIFGTGYDCNPSSFGFDAAGNVYVGQADCSGDVLKFNSAGTLLATFNVAVGNRGTDHIDLGSDGCTLYYASRTLDVLRFNVCTNAQMPNFNAQPLPGEAAYHIRLIPGGGLLVADSATIVRLDAAGNQVQNYFVAGEANYWGGVDVVGDGTFWATNAATANVYHFNLTTGAVLGSFNTGTGNFTVAGVAVKP